MAKVKAPLFSFGASGKLGDSIVFSIWKGIATVRQYVTPSNPQTDAQVEQRGLMTDIVNAWRRTGLEAAVKLAWDKLAATLSDPMSGWNAFCSNLVRLIAELPGASYVSSVVATAADGVGLGLLNIIDGLTGTEAGDFQILFGDDPANLVNSATASITAGSLTFGPDGAGFEAGDVIYVSVRKSGGNETVYERAGILEITLT